MTTLAAICRPDVPPERLRELARAAEDSGLDELWLWEDCFWGGAASAAAAALAWTGRLRVGIGVIAGDAPAIAAAVGSWAHDGAETVALYPPSDDDPVAFVRFAAQKVRPLVS